MLFQLRLSCPLFLNKYCFLFCSFFFLSPFVEMGFWLCLIFGFLWCRGGWRIGEWADCSRATSSIHSKQRTGLWWGLLLRKLHLTRNQGPRFRPESISSPMPLVSLSVPGVIAELLPLLVIVFNISSHFLIASLYLETIIDLYSLFGIIIFRDIHYSCFENYMKRMWKFLIIVKRFTCRLVTSCSVKWF